ncbi:hypothetical protein CDAR_109761 [Caerostris darwini]|uniref:Uncharacterized protein n=1 Tax=Caerostris darwini TaxID=1538125 RepID=A0AAV4SS21_9ARAC|nr:hypothetical protein CDAR_109761 [Caerostris darwini]
MYFAHNKDINFFPKTRRKISIPVFSPSETPGNASTLRVPSDEETRERIQEIRDGDKTELKCQSSQPQGNTKQNIGDKERDKAELKYPNLVIFCVDRNQIKDSSIDISPHALIPAFLLKALLASKEAYLYQRC